MCVYIHAYISKDGCCVRFSSCCASAPVLVLLNKHISWAITPQTPAEVLLSSLRPQVPKSLLQVLIAIIIINSYK